VTQPNGPQKIYSTIVAIVCVSLVCFITVLAIATYGMNGETLKIVVVASIIAIAGLGGYELRQNSKIS